MQKIFVFISAVYFKSYIYASGSTNPEDSGIHATDLVKIKNNTLIYGSLAKKIKDCIDADISNIDRSHINTLISLLQETLSIYKEHQSKVYEKIMNSTNCKMPLAPKNGGLVCVYFDSVYYCKPMCNQGYDFSFMRRSRLYEKCGSETGFSWTSQYIGGSRLAECIASSIEVSGVSSAYFRTDKCQNVVRKMKKEQMESKEQKYIDEFIKELEKDEVNKDHKNEFDFVVCGD
ncbi:uncharacterized protein LOC135057589 [Pseudophryne corroboree]|uniref:uncharacterized protein LOC135057589 n=1 Tax=Pseudophryne corroboree TaxID=495146 RepID=UPI003081D841